MVFNGSNGNDMVIFNEHADSHWAVAEKTPEWLI